MPSQKGNLFIVWHYFIEHESIFLFHNNFLKIAIVKSKSCSPFVFALQLGVSDFKTQGKMLYDYQNLTTMLLRFLPLLLAKRAIGDQTKRD